jgi:Predicted membrane protein
MIMVNVLAAVLFCFDKFNAKHHNPRISEKLLHLIEIIGGVFATVVCMHIIKHKNRKFTYKIVSYIILILWIVLIYNYMNIGV